MWPTAASRIVSAMTQTMQQVSDPKIETIQRVYEAFGRADLEAILAEVADDVDWSAEAAGRSAPWYGPHRGKDGVARFVQELASSVAISDFTPLSFTSNETDVMATVRFACTALATGRPASETLHHWFRFAGGKIVFYRGSDDSELTASLFA